MTEKYKILTISDHPLSHSGVALQTRYVIEHLLKTGKFKVISIAVAMRHEDMRIGKTHEFGDDFIIVPATRYDDQHLIRQILDAEKPDALWTRSRSIAQFYGIAFGTILQRLGIINRFMTASISLVASTR
jgi:hypothetical protein